MNRDIEFRVWDDHYKYMNYKVIVGIYGNWEEVKDNENYTACSMWIEPKKVDYKCEPHWSHFEPYHKEIKLMQYTGLKDKNGKKIFEGDIIRLDDDYRKLISSANAKTEEDLVRKDCLVGFKEGSFMFCRSRYFIDEFDSYLWLAEKHCEVIGNIYENKGLLK